MAKNLNEPSLNIRKKIEVPISRSTTIVGIDRCNTSPAQPGGAGESAAAGGPKCKNYVCSREPLPVGANCEAHTVQKVIKSNCSPVEVLFFFESEKSSSVHENL